MSTCLNCGETLWEAVWADELGHLAIHEDTPIRLEGDQSGFFYRCPHCLMKNVVTVQTNPRGLPQLKLSHVKN